MRQSEDTIRKEEAYSEFRCRATRGIRKALKTGIYAKFDPIFAFDRVDDKCVTFPGEPIVTIQAHGSIWFDEWLDPALQLTRRSDSGKAICQLSSQYDLCADFDVRHKEL